MIPLLTPQQVAKHLGISPSTVHYWRTIGDGPPYIKMGGSVRYLPKDIQDWPTGRRGRGPGKNNKGPVKRRTEPKPRVTDMEGYLTLSETASRLEILPGEVYALIRECKLHPYYRAAHLHQGPVFLITEVEA